MPRWTSDASDDLLRCIATEGQLVDDREMVIKIRSGRWPHVQNAMTNINSRYKQWNKDAMSSQWSRLRHDSILPKMEATTFAPDATLGDKVLIARGLIQNPAAQTVPPPQQPPVAQHPGQILQAPTPAFPTQAPTPVSQVHDAAFQVPDPVFQAQVHDPVFQTQVHDQVFQTQVHDQVFQTQFHDPVFQTQAHDPVFQTQVHDPIFQTQVHDPIFQTQVPAPVFQTQSATTAFQTQSPTTAFQAPAPGFQTQATQNASPASLVAPHSASPADYPGLFLDPALRMDHNVVLNDSATVLPIRVPMPGLTRSDLERMNVMVATVQGKTVARRTEFLRRHILGLASIIRSQGLPLNEEYTNVEALLQMVRNVLETPVPAGNNANV